MMLDAAGAYATPHTRSTCPGCHGELLSKCGPIVTWHWSHLADDCDPWSEPESEWHRQWKRLLRAELDAKLEVVMPPHRADIVLFGGRVLELQAGYLSAEQIEDRERFYGRNMIWLYQCHWWDRVKILKYEWNLAGHHYDPKDFWWKSGAKAMMRHNCSMLWDTGDGQLRRVVLYPQYGGKSVYGRLVDEFSTKGWLQWLKSLIR
jgi:competence CoiA-like predicted nuclease